MGGGKPTYLSGGSRPEFNKHKNTIRKKGSDLKSMSELFVSGGEAEVLAAIQAAVQLPTEQATLRLGEIAVSAHGALPFWNEGFTAAAAYNVGAEAIGYLQSTSDGMAHYTETVQPRLLQLENSNLLRLTASNIAGKTKTPWWHDYAYNLAGALNDGACGNTTNPLLVWAAIQANPDKWLPVLHKLWKKHPTYTAEQICLEMTVLVIAEHAALLRPIFDATGGQFGHVSMQLAPNCAMDGEATLAQSIVATDRLKELGITNAVFKVAGTSAGLDVVPEIARATGMPFNITVNYMLAQQLRFAEAIEALQLNRVSYLTQMNGRLAAAVIADLPDVNPVLIQTWAMHAIRQQAYLDLYLQRGYVATRPLGAAIRGPWDLDGAMYNGPVPFCVTMFPDMQELYNEIERTLDPNGLMKPLPKGMMNTLLTSSAFRLAFDPNADPSEFDTFPATVATLTQFNENYDACVKWCAENKPA